MIKSSGKEATPGDNPDVVILKAAEAPKLSPRGEGGIAYQIGMCAGSLYARIEKNHGGGSCSKEWVPVERIRTAFSPAMKRGEPFKSHALASAFVGRSQCNSGFLVAGLRAEGIFSPDEKRNGLSKLTGDIDGWEKQMRGAAPLLGDDGQPVTVKLHPEPKETKFCPKAQTGGGSPAADGTAPDGQEKPKLKLRIKKKASEPPTTPPDAAPDAESDHASAGAAVA